MFPPCARACAAMLAGWRLHRREQPLRDLARRRLSERSAPARSELGGVPRKRCGAGCPVAQRRGRGQLGACSWPIFLHEQEGRSPAGASPGAAGPASESKRSTASKNRAHTQHPIMVLSHFLHLPPRPSSLPSPSPGPRRRQPYGQPLSNAGRSCRSAGRPSGAQRPRPSAPAGSGCRLRGARQTARARAPCPAAVRGCRRSGP